MDVFSLLKFWRTSGGVDPTPAVDFNSSFDDEFFDLVFTTSGDDNNNINQNINDSSPDDYSNNKRRILPLDSLNNTKTPQSPLRLLNLKLGFQNNQKSKLQTEEVKIGALLKRDNSLRHQLRTEKLLETDQASSKRFSKDVINKYLNIMKPSYVAVSKRSYEKTRFSDTSITPSSPASSVFSFSPRMEERKSGGRGAVFREVRKHLGKSRSASEIVQTPARKSDDSALQQQDGIQGAILHCKRSYNSPSQGCVFSRSGSAPSNNQARASVEEQKRSSI